MRIAIVAYDFPPLNSGGSQRPYYFSKFLSSAGHDVVVFTLSEDSYPKHQLNYSGHDDSLSKIKIVRFPLKREILSANIFNSYYFNIVDRIGQRWKKNLRIALLSNHQKEPFDFLFFTCPPFSLAQIGELISKEIKVPLILDFRDAWSQWVTSPYASYLHYKKVVRLERAAIEFATIVTHTSRQQKDDFLRIHKSVSGRKFVYMPNGFEEYTNIPIINSGNIQIFYSGSFYYNPDSENLITKSWYRKKPYQYFQYTPRVELWKYRSPFYFFKIIKRLYSLDPDLASRIKIRIAGIKPVWFDKMVEDFNLENSVLHLGFLNKEQNQTELEKADFFLLTSSKIPGGNDYSVAGKTFEYFSFRKPVISVVCDGEQKTLMENSGLGIVLDPDRSEEAADQLKSFLETTIYDPDWSFIDQFRIPNNYKEIISALETYKM